MLNSCVNKDDSTGFIKKQYGLTQYEYLLIIHISPKNCISCLYALQYLNNLQALLDENGKNTLVMITGKNNDEFWNLYHSLELTVTYIEPKDFQRLNLPNNQAVPYCYFYDLKRNHLIFQDFIPKEEATFLALTNLVEKYSGVLF